MIPALGSAWAVCSLFFSAAAMSALRRAANAASASAPAASTPSAAHAAARFVVAGVAPAAGAPLLLGAGAASMSGWQEGRGRGQL